MTIYFKVRNMTIEAVPCFEKIRQGSEEFLKVSFEFDETWDKFNSKYIYFASEGYADFFELDGFEYDVPDYYAAQEYFEIQLSAHNNGQKIPTNKISVTLDPSGEIWISEPPESMAEGIQQLIDAAEEAKSIAKEALEKQTQTDETLTKKGIAADAKVTGEKIANLKAVDASLFDGSAEIDVKSVTADDVFIGNVSKTIRIQKVKRENGTVGLQFLANEENRSAVVLANLRHPEQIFDAATKYYVDNEIKNNLTNAKIPIVDAIPADMKDGDVFILHSDEDDVPTKDPDVILPEGTIPDATYVTEDQMHNYVRTMISEIEPEDIGCDMTIDEQECENVGAALNALANRGVGGSVQHEYIVNEPVIQYDIPFEIEKYHKYDITIVQPSPVTKTKVRIVKNGHAGAVTGAAYGIYHYILTIVPRGEDRTFDISGYGHGSGNSSLVAMYGTGVYSDTSNSGFNIIGETELAKGTKILVRCWK